MTTKQLLFATALLVVLALSLFALLQKHQAGRKEVIAMRNMQQWGIALNLYLIDNRNELPQTGQVPITTDQTQAWFNALPPYLSRKPLAELPPTERPRPGVPSFWMNPMLKARRVWDNEQFFFALAMNRWLQPDPALRPFRINELGVPSKVIFLSETNCFSPLLDPDTLYSAWRASNPNSASSASFVLFCDGHAELVPRSKLLDPAALLAPTDSFPLPASWFKE
jgi:hypothetical protein